MAILDLQKRIREVGRIRIGVLADTRSGKKAPKKIETFRLTSQDRRIIEAAAGIYGGTVERWSRDPVDHWQVMTTVPELSIALPPDTALSQDREVWSKGGCTKRCDGRWDSKRGVACDCDPDNRECKLTTRLNVLLPEVPGLGQWRLDSHGYFAATELAGAVELVQQMSGRGAIIPARLRLEQRELRRIIDGKAEVHRFGVPVIDIDVSILGVQALSLRVGDVEVRAGDTASLEGAWRPVPEPEPPAALSVASQVEDAIAPRKAAPRKNAAAPLPATGRTPRTAIEAAPERCHLCGKDYGAEPLVKNRTDTGGRYVHRACQTVEPSTAVDGPPAVHQEASSGGGVDDGTSPPVEPAPAAARPDPMTPNQRKKMHAMTAKLWPVDVEKVTGAEATEWRRGIVLGICGALGAVGLTTRNDIDKDTAVVLLDALEAIDAGQVQWDDDKGQLVDLATGAILGTRR